MKGTKLTLIERVQPDAREDFLIMGMVFALSGLLLAKNDPLPHYKECRNEGYEKYTIYDDILGTVTNSMPHYCMRVEKEGEYLYMSFIDRFDVSIGNGSIFTFLI